MNTKYFTAGEIPNLAAEILCHNAGSVYHCAKMCGMEEEEMYGFLKGERAIDANKINKLAKELGHCSEEYLKSKKLAYYDLNKEKHRRKLLVLNRNSKHKRLGPVNDIAKRKIFLRAWYNNMVLSERQAN